MRKVLPILCFVFSSFGVVYSQEEIPLYPKGVEESNDLQVEESWRDSDFILNISNPRMYAYMAPKEKATGTAVLICPGGGYSGLSTIKEGKEIAEWFNKQGVSAFVLFYRMPNGHHEIPLKDAQTALSIIDKNARKWGVNRKKVGVIGFSAGGHLASTLGTHFTKDSERPAFMILAYPVISMDDAITHKGSQNNLLGKEASKELKDRYSNELRVTKDTPPTFLVHTKDDQAVPEENSKRFYRALLKNNVRCEFQPYLEGGHGFGMRAKKCDSDKWTDRLSEWLKAENLIK